MSLPARWVLLGSTVLCMLWPARPLTNLTSYNVLVLMVEKSLTNRFDLVHIGPAIDIAQKVLLLTLTYLFALLLILLEMPHRVQHCLESDQR